MSLQLNGYNTYGPLVLRYLAGKILPRPNEMVRSGTAFFYDNLTSSYGPEMPANPLNNALKRVVINKYHRNLHIQKREGLFSCNAGKRGM